jgi:putative membrane protein
MKTPHRGLIYSAVCACSLVSLPLFAHPVTRPGAAENPLVVLDVLIPMLIAAAWYACGVIRLWRRSGAGRGLRPFHVTLFVLGWLSLFAALLSRLDELGAELFSAHMVQHEVLMLVAGPGTC